MVISSKEDGYTNFIVFGLTRRGIEPESIISLADVLSTGRFRTPFICSYLLPDKARTTKQKTPKVVGKGRLDFDHLFTYTNVHTGELEQRCIELTVWESGRFGAKQIIGGARIGPGTGMFWKEID